MLMGIAGLARMVAVCAAVSCAVVGGPVVAVLITGGSAMMLVGPAQRGMVALAWVGLVGLALGGCEPAEPVVPPHGCRSPGELAIRMVDAGAACVEAVAEAWTCAADDAEIRASIGAELRAVRYHDPGYAP